MASVERLARGGHSVLMGLQGNVIVATPLSEIVGRDKLLDPHGISASCLYNSRFQTAANLRGA